MRFYTTGPHQSLPTDLDRGTWYNPKSAITNTFDFFFFWISTFSTKKSREVFSEIYLLIFALWPAIIVIAVGDNS